VSPESRRFLVVTPALDGRDGISEVSRQVVRALIGCAGAGSVETWAYRGAEPRSDRVPPHRFRAAAGRRWQLIAWALVHASRSLADLTVVAMHAHLAPVAHILASRGAQRVIFIHGIEAWQQLRRREAWAMRGDIRIVANSRRTATFFHAANPALPAAAVCPLGIGAPPAAIRWSGEPGFALIVGRLSASERYKGHDALIEAWPLVLDAIPGARLVIAGEGDDRERLEQRVQRERLGSAILLLGSVPDAELRGLYQACGMYVMPSSGEGFGLAFLEAMREGKPCVALRASEEIVVDGATGLLLDSADPPALAEVVIRLFRDPALRHRLGQAGAVRARTLFEERHFARRFTNAIGLRALSQRRAAPPTMSASA
jgi:phosphatidylinositol alpha-1,6-mannosyltransferase